MNISLFLLEYSCFTMLCWFPLWLSYMCVSIPSLLDLPPTPLSRHRAQSWASCAKLHLPTSCLFSSWWCIYVSALQSLTALSSDHILVEQLWTLLNSSSSASSTTCGKDLPYSMGRGMNCSPVGGGFQHHMLSFQPRETWPRWWEARKTFCEEQRRGGSSSPSQRGRRRENTSAVRLVDCCVKGRVSRGRQRVGMAGKFNLGANTLRNGAALRRSWQLRAWEPRPCGPVVWWLQGRGRGGGGTRQLSAGREVG